MRRWSLGLPQKISWRGCLLLADSCEILMASPMQEITAKQTPTNAGAKFSSEKASISVKCELGVDFCRDCVCVCVCSEAMCVGGGGKNEAHTQ